MPRARERARALRRRAAPRSRPAALAALLLLPAAPLAVLLALLAAPAPAAGQEDAAGTVYDRPPVCSYIPALRYPPSVRDRSLGGDVLVRVHLDRRGRVARTEVLETGLPQIFEVEALRAVNLSRFHPAWHAGRTVESALLMPFRFLPQEESPPAAAEPAAAAAPTEAERAATGTPAHRDETRLGRPRTEATAEPPHGTRTAEAETPDEPLLGTRADEAAAPAETPRTETAGDTEAPAADTRVETPAETAGPAPFRTGEPDGAAAPRADADLRLVDAAFGLGVSGGRLRDAADTFVEGERVYFWTRVDGAPAGEHTPLHHVWIWRGREVQTIDLSLKGPAWRTWSYKTLFGGLAGDWRVEARDAEGRVLGSRAFTCLPRGDAED